ncbi:electron carrier DRE2 Ecym_5479 [Eremothecium cymbalariae DBVPG|uniref:Uncharacterized protein n=1 Tax=Eremothecium cymbalariae (strain CBS 270.75 / DBVPG 7215 / KCTC 17166 / NRRL Y-17582) TaxID=931890 RepID=I6NDT3_ERECY|nr:hypothetical protein Ecym_5479 [Eremothecium cymbalariae DBVPG\
MSAQKNSLLLIHPAITTMPALLEKTKQNPIFQNSALIDQYLINKLNDSKITLEDEKYDIIYYLTPESLTELHFPAKLIPVLRRALKNKGKLYGLCNNYKIEALVNGFEIVEHEDPKSYHWFKKPQTHSTPVSLHIRESSPVNAAQQQQQKQKKEQAQALPRFIKQKIAISIDEANRDYDELLDNATQINVDPTKLSFFETTKITNDDFLAEDELVAEDDFNDDAITMLTCTKSQTKRRKACKDCTCGLKDQEQEYIDTVSRRQDGIIGVPVSFTEEELTEIDFTIEGKKVGGCGSCSLGDAFRCSGCPYLGLPAFKPGQPIKLNSISDDL